MSSEVEHGGFQIRIGDVLKEDIAPNVRGLYAEMLKTVENNVGVISVEIDIWCGRILVIHAFIDHR